MNKNFWVDDGLERLFRAAIPQPHVRLQFEDGCRAVANVVGSQNHDWMKKRLERFLIRILNGEESAAIGLRAPGGAGSEKVMSAVESYIRSDEKCRAYWCRIYESQVRAEVCLVALFAVLRLAVPEDEVGLLPFVRRYLVSVQADMLGARARKAGKSVLFYLARPEHSLHFGNVPDLLRNSGTETFIAYGFPDEHLLRQSRSHFYFESVSAFETLADISLFVLPECIENLPSHVIRMLVERVSICQLEPTLSWLPVSSAIQKLEPSNKTGDVLQDYGLQEKLFSLYDYHVVSSKANLAELMRVAEFYGYTEVENGLPKGDVRVPTADGAKILQMLMGKRVCSDIRFILAGSQRLKHTLGRVKMFADHPDAITFSPMVLIDDPEKRSVYAQLSINEHCTEVLESLLSAYPARTVIFRPHQDMPETKVNQIIHSLRKYSNLSVQRTGHEDDELFARTAVFITDFSEDAFFFACATLRPVVFYSRNEALANSLAQRMDEHNFIAHRTAIGIVTESIKEILVATAQLLEESGRFAEQISKFCEEQVFHSSDSDAQILRGIRLALGQSGLTDCIQLRHFS